MPIGKVSVDYEAFLEKFKNSLTDFKLDVPEGRSRKS
jgi:hypothetical protein